MIETLIAKYIKARDLKATLKAEYDLKVEALDSAMEKIENVVLAKLNEMGTDSFGVKGVGTAYKSAVTSATVADWDATLQFIKDNDMWNLLDHRVNKTAVVEYRKANDDLPPGVNWREEHVVRIRRD